MCGGWQGCTDERPFQCTATELLAMYAAGTASPVEATRAVLDRIEAVNPTINAFAHLAPDEALAAAAASEIRWRRGEPVGPLDGVPTTIKDLVLTKGWPTLRGSRTIDPDQPWDVDAPATARLREAGAILVGKTTTPEFGCKGETNSALTGLTRNPWDPTKTPGGSSGGTAAAVAAGLRAARACGSDGAGSVRIPAAFCGNVGLKPSFGRVPAYPLSPFGTVSHLGPHTMSVADAALMLNVLQQPDARDWTSLPPTDTDNLAGLDDGVAGLRIAYSATLGYADVARRGRRRRGRRPSRTWPPRVPSSRPSIPGSRARWRSRPACGSRAPGRCGTRCRPSSRRSPTPTSPPRPSSGRASATSTCNG